MGALHHLHVLQRAGRPGCGGVRHRPYHGLRVAPPRLRHRGRLPGPPGAEGRVWIDELYLTDSDIVRSADYVPKRGLSKNKICIAVAIDAYKNAVVAICGHGKPSSRRIRDALLSHIAPGSVIVHDMEKAHMSLVRAAKCTDEAYKADVKDPVYLEAMELVNNLCSWLRRYLFRFPGMKKGNLQSYLNWFVYLFRVRRDEEKWPKTARVMRHLLMTDAHYRSSR